MNDITDLTESSPQKKRRLAARNSRLSGFNSATEFFFNTNIKQEPEFQEDIKDDLLGIFGSVDDCYCRICFKIFTTSDSRNEIDTGVLSILRELLQLGIKLSNGSQWICGTCSSTVNTFWTFKYDVIDKQAKFSQLVLQKGHKDLEEIQKIHSGIDDMQPEICVKAEPTFSTTEFSDDLFEMPSKRIQREKPAARKKYKKVKAPQTCDECGKQALNLLNHKIKKHGLKHLFECSHCTFSSYEKKKLQYHIQSAHVKKKKVVEQHGS